MDVLIEPYADVMDQMKVCPVCGILLEVVSNGESKVEVIKECRKDETRIRWRFDFEYSWTLEVTTPKLRYLQEHSNKG